MDQFKELRAHPKMTKALLEQIESLQKQNHTTDEISATLGITPESVQRGTINTAPRFVQSAAVPLQ